MRRVITDIGRSRAPMMLVAVLAASSAWAAPGPLLHPVFQDHAVLQRDRSVSVWGKGAANDSVTISLGAHTATARADEAGNWKASLPAMSAGGPFNLKASASSGATQTVSDVLIGDVWLCSGQSNMVLPVHRALDSRSEIAGSANDTIRMLTVDLANAVEPRAQFAAPVQWRVAGPDTVAEFSATCFYFARELQKTAKVPMGLITSAWGGSKIEAWMSAQGLRDAGGYDTALDVLSIRRTDVDAAAKRWGAEWEAWWHRQSMTRNIADPWAAKMIASQWRTAPAALGHWENWGVPELQRYNGALWYRTTASVSAQQATQRARLVIGGVDEADQTWVNGRAVGNDVGFFDAAATDKFGKLPRGPRAYYLNAGTLKAGENAVVISVLDTYANGGLYGPASQRAIQFEDGSAVALDREWFYQLPPRGAETPPRAPWDATAGVTTIYNAMIAPVANYSIRGVAWYQGESNTEEAGRYQSLLRHFMADWRRAFATPDLPFLIVQLANYGTPPTVPGESNWAALREAQRRAAAADRYAGLAIAIDIGDRYDIHPANKQEVGRRLARAARRVVYGETIAASGPIPVEVAREGDRAIVRFADVDRRLISYGADHPIGFELCGSEAGTCRFAEATLDGSRVTLQTEAPATRVRYCWADSPVCTLYDESGLPAGPFELAIDPRSPSH